MSEGFSQRLARLRRESGTQPPAPGPVSGPLSGPSQTPRPQDAARSKGAPAWVAARLRGRARQLPRSGPLPHASTLPTTLGEPERLEEQAGVWARVSDFPWNHHHGDFALEEAFEIESEAFTCLTGDERLTGLDPRRAVYLDTETTGLDGGAGTYVYLVALGTFEEGCFRVWQGFLRGPEGERELLAACAERIAAAETMISFFGKSFDRHRLEDKMRCHGIAPPFERPHLDLYHPLRRLMGGSLRDGRLATLERSLCAVEREEDLPGSQAPAAWFDYLAGRPHRLEGVFQHNLDDVLSLVTLTGYLGRVLRETRRSGAPLAGCPASRARAIARSLLLRRRRTEALPWLERAIERHGGLVPESRDLALERAEALRLAGEHDLAEESYRALIEGGRDRYAVLAGIGLAKLLEHGRGDRPAAYRCCLDVQSLLPKLSPSEGRRLGTDLERRLARLAPGAEAGCRKPDCNGRNRR